MSNTLCDLNAKQPITHLIHGAAPGADTLAAGWAFDMGITVVACHADWTKHGRAAGPIRNGEMLKREPDLVVAFPGGRGTANMVRQAKAAGVRVVEVAAPVSSATPKGGE